mmetsp:Transcript_30197/g.37875  ORF Transcript_30197/g.37875 Transcript_30197/m.37875 type:complete len:396 (+) Transcript_30197:1230-2417(+)
MCVKPLHNSQMPFLCRPIQKLLPLAEGSTPFFPMHLSQRFSVTNLHHLHQILLCQIQFLEENSIPWWGGGGMQVQVDVYRRHLLHVQGGPVQGALLHHRHDLKIPNPRSQRLGIHRKGLAHGRRGGSPSLVGIIPYNAPSCLCLNGRSSLCTTLMILLNIFPSDASSSLCLYLYCSCSLALMLRKFFFSAFFMLQSQEIFNCFYVFWGRSIHLIFFAGHPAPSLSLDLDSSFCFCFKLLLCPLPALPSSNFCLNFNRSIFLCFLHFLCLVASYSSTSLCLNGNRCSCLFHRLAALHAEGACVEDGALGEVVIQGFLSLLLQLGQALREGLLPGGPTCAVWPHTPRLRGSFQLYRIHLCNNLLVLPDVFIQLHDRFLEIVVFLFEAEPSTVCKEWL